MILIAMLIGAVLIVAALRNSQGDLGMALGQDVPQFAVWGAAILAIGALGYVKGLTSISRGLLALVIVVIVLKDYNQIISGFQNAWQGAAAQGQAGEAQQSGAGQGAATGGVIGTAAGQLISGAVGDATAGLSSGLPAADTVAGAIGSQETT